MRNIRISRFKIGAVVIALILGGVWLRHTASQRSEEGAFTPLAMAEEEPLRTLADLARPQPLRAGWLEVKPEAMELAEIRIGTSRLETVAERLAVVAFGQRTAVELPPGAAPFDGFVHVVGRNASDLHHGVEAALAPPTEITPVALPAIPARATAVREKPLANGAKPMAASEGQDD